MAKKTKKIETPIDQRETFMSISRTFADSDLSVEEKLKTLYDLQAADTAIDKILQLRGELPLEVQTLEAELEEIGVKIAAAKAAIAEDQDSIDANKLRITDCEAQIAKYKSQVDQISNSREYDSINKEIENQDLLLQIAQKYINEARERIAGRKAELEALEDKKQVKEADLEAKREDLASIVDSTAKEEESLQIKRAECAAKIDERTMSAYERIRGSVHNHLAVVGIYNQNACGGCLNTIPPQRLIDIASNKKVIICEYCGRILVNPDFE